MIRNIAIIAVSMSLLVAAGAGHADAKKDARKHFKVGISLLKGDDFKAAAAEFEASVKLYPTKTGLFNLANCYKALHDYRKTLHTLERLKKDFGDDFDDDMKSTVETMESEILDMMGQLKIVVTQKGATIKLDGKEVGKSPLIKPVLVPPGGHSVEIMLSGYKTETRKVKLVSGDAATEYFDLKEGESGAATEAEPTGEEEAEVEEEAGEEDVGEETDTGKGVSPLLIGGIVAGGLGLGGVAVGAVFTAKHGKALDEGEDARAAGDPAAYSDAQDESKKFKTGAIVGFAAGGALVATGAVLIVLHFMKKKKETTAVVTPTLGGVSVSF